MECDIFHISADLTHNQTVSVCVCVCVRVRTILVLHTCSPLHLPYLENSGENHFPEVLLVLSWHKPECCQEFKTNPFNRILLPEHEKQTANYSGCSNNYMILAKYHFIQYVVWPKIWPSYNNVPPASSDICWLFWRNIINNRKLSLYLVTQQLC
jgi:hypothetical protein